MQQKKLQQLNKILLLKGQGKSIEEISSLVGLPVGSFKEDNTIKRILYIESRRAGGIAVQKTITKEDRQKRVTKNNYFKRMANNKEWHISLGKRGGTATQKKWRGSIEQKKWCSKAGKISAKINKTLTSIRSKKLPKEHFSKMGKRTAELYPNHVKEMRKKALLNNPDFYEKKREIARRTILKLNPAKLAAKARQKMRLKGRCVYNGISYDSFGEIKYCKKLELLGYIPIPYKTLHVPIGNKEVDFIFKDTVYEYHPYDFTGKSKTEYFNERRQLLDDNGYNKYKLVVI